MCVVGCGRIFWFLGLVSVGVRLVFGVVRCGWGVAGLRVLWVVWCGGCGCVLLVLFCVVLGFGCGFWVCGFFWCFLVVVRLWGVFLVGLVCLNGFVFVLGLGFCFWGWFWV